MSAAAAQRTTDAIPAISRQQLERQSGHRIPRGTAFQFSPASGELILRMGEREIMVQLTLYLQLLAFLIP